MTRGLCAKRACLRVLKILSLKILNLYKNSRILSPKYQYIVEIQYFKNILENIGLLKNIYISELVRIQQYDIFKILSPKKYL